MSLCIRFGCYQICHICRSLNYVNFGSIPTKVYFLDTLYLVIATPPTILPGSF